MQQDTILNPSIQDGRILIKRLLLIALGLFNVLLLGGALFIKWYGEPSLFMQPFYKLNHTIYSVQDIGKSHPRREVAVQLSNTERANPKAEALACVRAFEILSVDDGQTLTCRVFQNERTYQEFQKDGSSCVIAQAIQPPYGKAENAEAKLNPAFHCGD